MAMVIKRRCIQCYQDVRTVVDQGGARNICNCTTLDEGAIIPAYWLRYNTPLPQPPPADNGKCLKCGKDMDTVGLNQVYPPKKDDMGHVICPHCGYVHGAVGQGGGNSNLFDAAGVAIQQMAPEYADRRKAGNTGWVQRFRGLPGKGSWGWEKEEPK